MSFSHSKGIERNEDRHKKRWAGWHGLSQVQVNWLDRRIPSASEYRLDLRSIFIFPSKFGWAFILMLLALFILGTNYQNNLMLLLCYFLLALLLINLFISYLNFAQLSVKLGKLAPSYSGEKAQLPLWFDQHDNKASGKLLLHFWQAKTGIEVDLDNLNNPVCLEQPAEKRGWLDFPRVTINSYYPLGLFRCWTHLNFNGKCLIYPAPLACHIQLSAIEGGQSDSHLTGHTPGQDEFESLKNYQQGEPLNHVAWKQVAKGQGMLSKEFVSQTSALCYLQLTPCQGQALEKTLSQLCYQVRTLSQQGTPFGLKLGEQIVGPSSGEQHQQACLAALALYQA